MQLDFGNVGFPERGKPECYVPRKTSRSKGENLIWLRCRDLNSSHIGERWVLSPLRHPSYTRFQKGFQIEIYIYKYIYTFVFLRMRPCASFTRYCPTCEKTRFNDKFFLLRVLCYNLKRTCCWVFFRKVHAPCNTNLQWLIIWLIISRHTENNFFLIFCVVP